MLPRLLAALLLAAPATAQDAAALMACFEGIDIEEIDARANAFAEERGFEAQADELCDADRDAAAAYADEIEAEFYARSGPEVAALHDCLEAAGYFTEDPANPEPHVCDAR